MLTEFSFPVALSACTSNSNSDRIRSGNLEMLSCRRRPLSFGTHHIQLSTQTLFKYGALQESIDEVNKQNNVPVMLQARSAMTLSIFSSKLSIFVLEEMPFVTARIGKDTSINPSSFFLFEFGTHLQECSG